MIDSLQTAWWITAVHVHTLIESFNAIAKFHVHTFIDSLYTTRVIATFHVHTLIDSLCTHLPATFCVYNYIGSLYTTWVIATFQNTILPVLDWTHEYRYTMIDSLHNSMMDHDSPCTHFDWEVEHYCNIPCTHFDWQLVSRCCLAMPIQCGSKQSSYVETIIQHITFRVMTMLQYLRYSCCVQVVNQNPLCIQYLV